MGIEQTDVLDEYVSDAAMLSRASETGFMGMRKRDRWDEDVAPAETQKYAREHGMFFGRHKEFGFYALLAPLTRHGEKCVAVLQVFDLGEWANGAAGTAAVDRNRYANEHIDEIYDRQEALDAAKKEEQKKRIRRTAEEHAQRALSDGRRALDGAPVFSYIKREE